MLGGQWWNDVDANYPNISGFMVEFSVLPGDFNHSGTVDAADYVVWRKTDGTPAGYNVWRTHFDETNGSGSGAITNANVSESATSAMFLVAVAGWCVRRGRATY
jgi:hypothetical protein